MTKRMGTKIELEPEEVLAQLDEELDPQEEADLDALEALHAQVRQAQTGTYGRDYLRRQYNLLRLALRDREPEYRNRVFEIVVQFGLDPNDPAFLLLIATGRLEVLLEEKPEELKRQFNLWSQELEKNWQRYEAASAQRIEAKVATAAEHLLRKTAIDRFMGAIRSGIWFVSVTIGGAIIAGSMIVGMVMGASWQRFGTRYAPGAQNLTVEEAAALEWVLSDQGQYARQLYQWNQDLLLTQQGDGRLCEVEAIEAGLTRTTSVGEAQRGFCLLWVAPPSQRDYR